MLRHFPLILLTIAYCPATSAFTYRDISEKACREKTPHTTVTHASGEDDVSLSLPSLFWTKSSGNILRRRYCCLVLQATSGRSSDSDKGKDGGGKKGYRFGDITKSLIGGSVEKVRYITIWHYCSDRTCSESTYTPCRLQASLMSLEVRMKYISRVRHDILCVIRITCNALILPMLRRSLPSYRFIC